MAAAAYATLISLSHVLDNLQHPARLHRLSLDRNRIQTLQENVGSLQEFLETYSQTKSHEIEDLARQIAVVAYEAEEMIDLTVVDQLCDRSDQDLSSLSFSEDVDEVIQKIESIKKELMILEKQWTNHVQEQQPGVLLPGGSSTSTFNSSKNTTMVGFDEHLDQIRLLLTTNEDSLQIIPIVGMGGIGKTTLARNVFNDRCVIEYFPKRFWFTISQEYSVKKILVGLLNNGKIQGSNENSDELGVQLYKSLYGAKYLIVLDDVWSTAAWDDLKRYFPNNGNGSRVIVTTRLLDVAVSLGSHEPYFLSFLDKEKGWNLFCQTVFGKEGCPYPELEKMGKAIAKGCRGLPLAIVVVGGLLAKSNMTPEYWESVAANVNSFANSEDVESCLRILSLSYNSLPLHLKPCFLYMRVFREDAEIGVQELIRLWLVEGFLKPRRNKSLEDTAEEYLRDLAGRNLILIRQWTTRRRMKTCSIHDLLRDLCLKESRKEHFLHVPNLQVINPGFDLQRCFLCHNKPEGRIDLLEVSLGSRSTSITSPLVCEACKIKYPQLNRLRLVRIVDTVNNWIPEAILHHTRLRSLTLNIPKQSNLLSPSTMHLLWNLHTLILRTSVAKLVLPPDIWEAMPQLRHLEADNRIALPDPVVTPNEGEDSTGLVNLQTLLFQNFRCTQEVIERIPDLKKLKIIYGQRQVNWSYYSLQNLAHLHKLESLFLKGRNLFLKNITFPYSLKKLALEKCGIPWERMTIIGSLPNLEVVKLYDNAFRGPEWNPIEGEFLRLKVLAIQHTNLVHWNVENIHFPSLETLELGFAYLLEEIPASIGDIATLRLIDLRFCSDSVIESAKQIVEEQLSLTNESSELRVTDPCGRKYMADGFGKEIEEEKEEEEEDRCSIM